MEKGRLSTFIMILSATFKGKSESYRYTTIRLLSSGRLKVSDIPDLKRQLLEMENYEAVQGVDLAVKEFERSPQLSISLQL